MNNQQLITSLQESVAIREDQLQRLVDIASHQADIINHQQELLAGQDKRMHETNEMIRTLDNVPDSMMINAVYKLATDKLCDEDQVFNIRTYFNV